MPLLVRAVVGDHLQEGHAKRLWHKLCEGEESDKWGDKETSWREGMFSVGSLSVGSASVRSIVSHQSLSDSKASDSVSESSMIKI